MHLLRFFSPMDPLALEPEAERSRKLKLIKRAISEDTIDIKLIRQLSRTPYGLVNDEIRKAVWPMLLNLQREAVFDTFGSYSRDQKKKILADNPFYTLDPYQTWKKIAKAKNSYSSQIAKDIDRSMFSFDVVANIEPLQRDLLRAQLNRIIHAVLNCSFGEYNYYQGFHEICSVMLLVLGENMAFYASMVISRFFIIDFLQLTFHEGVIPLLKLVKELVGKVDSDIYYKIEFLDVPTFYVAHLLTWYCHSFEKFSVVTRLFDYILASPPSSIIYLTAAAIIYNKPQIMDLEQEDLAGIHCIFQYLEGPHFEVEDIIRIADSLMNDLPPVALRKLPVDGLPENSPILSEEYALVPHYNDNDRLKVVKGGAEKWEWESQAKQKGKKRVLRNLVGLGMSVGVMVATYLLQSY